VESAGFSFFIFAATGGMRPKVTIIFSKFASILAAKVNIFSCPALLSSAGSGGKGTPSSQGKRNCLCTVCEVSAH